MKARGIALNISGGGFIRIPNVIEISVVNAQGHCYMFTLDLAEGDEALSKIESIELYDHE